MQKIKQAILEYGPIAPLPEWLEGGRLPALISGLPEVCRAGLAAAVGERADAPVFVLCPDDAAAESFAEDLASFCGRPVPMMTEREFTLQDVQAVSHQPEHRRIAVLGELTDETKPPVVCTVGALMQRTMPRDVLERAMITLRDGMQIDPEELVDALLRIGYARAEKVEGVGQFARRGGIVDVWSPGMSDPVRAEFWGDELSELSVFDVSSQRRTERVRQMRLLPAAETLPCLAEGGRGGLAAALRQRAARLNPNAARFDPDRLRAVLLRDAEELENGITPAAADRYMALIYPAFATVLDYLREDTVLVMDQPGKCAERARSHRRLHLEDQKTLIESGVVAGSLALFELGWEELCAGLENFPVIMTDSFTVGQYPLPMRSTAGVTALQLPSYGGSIETAAQDVGHYVQSQWSCVALASDARRAEMLCRMLREKGLDAYEDKKLTELPAAGRCAVSVGTLSAGFELPQRRLAVLTDSQLLRQGVRTARRKKAVPAGARIGSYEDLSVGDLVVHENHGIGRFAGIFRMPVDGAEKDYVKICYAGSDSLYVPATQLDMVTKYIGAGEDSPVRLSKLGGTDWGRARTKARAAAKEMAGELIRLYAARQQTPGHAFAPDSEWQLQFEDAFDYEETGDQRRCTEEIKADMEKPVPMDRLLCGDVGYGKTEVALRAVMKCVLDGYQAAILVPTTVLAQQHYQTILGRFFGYPVKTGILSRFTTPAQLRETLRSLADGSCDIVVGTHRLLQKDIRFKKLGLLVVDEEQRFGVGHKEHIKEMAKQVDVLTLSATPIPRTLNMALTGLRDMSTLTEPPRDRLPVQTFVLEHDWELLADAIRRETARGGQVYYLHNRIDTISRCAARLQKLLEDVTIDVAHGRMDEHELSDVMERVSDGRTQVLVCTTIIETGIDIPNVNTLIIEDADKLGLAQLHQLRGRVGRSSRRAAAYLTYRKDKVLSEIAEKRLTAIRQFAEFNSGFRIALRDLEIRGAGNLLGADQSGHMADVGYDMYVKLLEEAVREARGETVPVRTECSADLTVSANIPQSYISNAEQRMDIYRRIALVRTEAEADDLTDELCDRFGDPPPSVNALIHVAILRGEASAVGITDIAQKGGVLRFVFDEFDFGAISALYAQEPWHGRVKVQAGQNPAVGLKLNSPRRVLEEARDFIRAYAAERKPASEA